jgi:hypothetical protein
MDPESSTGGSIATGGEWTILYTDHKNEHILATGFAIKKHIKRLITGYQGLTPRISTIALKEKFFNYTLTNAHSPTDASQIEEKEDRT